MSRVVVRRWSAWAPDQAGREIGSAAAWQAWSGAPLPLGREGEPEVPLLPAGLRRRATRLTRVMLRVAFDCSEGTDRAALRTVFASRHGAIHVAMKIIHAIAAGESVSPLQFSHSVHNAQAGLFSIACGNREASSSISAGEDSFGHAFLESLLSLERRPDAEVLLVIGDEPVPDNMSHLVSEPPATYGVGLLLARDGEGTPLDFAIEPCHAPRKPRTWPDAIEFVRFLASGEAQTCLESGRRRWCWRRADRDWLRDAALRPRSRRS